MITAFPCDVCTRHVSGKSGTSNSFATPPTWLMADAFITQIFLITQVYFRILQEKLWHCLTLNMFDVTSMWLRCVTNYCRTGVWILVQIFFSSSTSKTNSGAHPSCTGGIFQEMKQPKGDSYQMPPPCTKGRERLQP